MAITLARLLVGAEKTCGIRLLAGGRGTNVLVRWVHMVEDSEVPSFLRGNELVFTTGIAHRGTGWLTEFVKSLRANGAVGAVLNIGPYITEVPAEVIRYCNDNNFPLFTIPWDKRLTDVSYDLCHRIVASEADDGDMVHAFRALLFAPQQKANFIAPLARRGFYETEQYTILLLRGARSGVSVSGDELNSWKFGMYELALQSFDHPCFLFTIENHLIFISTGAGSAAVDAYAHKVCDDFILNRPNLSVGIGISDTVSGFSPLPECYRQASAAADTSLMRPGRIFRYNELGIYQLLYAVNDVSVLRRYVEGVLGRIQAYDTLHHSDYDAVLACYIRNNGSIQKAAEEMGVHRNTVNYKIKNIRELFGLKLDNEDIMRLGTAYCCREVLGGAVR